MFDFDQSEVEVPLSEDKVFVQGLDNRGRSLVIIKVGQEDTPAAMSVLQAYCATATCC